MNSYGTANTRAPGAEASGPSLEIAPDSLRLGSPHSNIQPIDSAGRAFQAQYMVSGRSQPEDLMYNEVSGAEGAENLRLMTAAGASLSPQFFQPRSSGQGVRDGAVETFEATANLYARSAHGNGDNLSSSDISRKTFQRVDLIGRNGTRSNNLVEDDAPPPLGAALGTAQPRETPGSLSQINAELLNLKNWSPEMMNKILYGLLQQIELVKYILQEGAEHSSQRYAHAGQRMIESIFKCVGPGQSVFGQQNPNGAKRNSQHQRTRIHSIDISSVKEIFVMINNFSLHFMQSDQNRHAFVLLQCAVQISKHYPEIMESSQLLFTLYNNLGMYHVKGKGKLSEQQSKRYIDGAIMANARSDALKNQGQAPNPLQQGLLHEKQQCEINLAICFNNRAVVELKRGSSRTAQEFSVKSIEMIEPKVYGMINSGLLQRQPSSLNEVNQAFQKMLQILLIAYFNLAASKDHLYESKGIYLKGLQLAYQYLQGGQNTPIFKKFHQKYSRKHYDLILVKQRRAGEGQRSLEGPTPRLPVPEILPLECIEEEVNESLTHQNYNCFINSFNVNAQPAQQPAEMAEDPAGFNDGNSFTILDSSRTRMTHHQNNQLLSSQHRLLLPRNQESVVSMPPMPTRIHEQQLPNSRQRQRNGLAGDGQNQINCHIQPQRSEIIQSNLNLVNLEEQRATYAREVQLSSSDINGNNLLETPDRNKDKHEKQLYAAQAVEAPNRAGNPHSDQDPSTLLMLSRANHYPANELSLGFRDSNLSRDVSAQDSAEKRQRDGHLRDANQANQHRRDHEQASSYQSSNLAVTAKFGPTPNPDSQSRKRSMPTATAAELEHRIEEERQRMQQEMRLQQEEMQRKMQEQQMQMQLQLYQQMMTMQQTQKDVGSAGGQYITMQQPKMPGQSSMESGFSRARVFENLSEQQRQMVATNARRLFIQAGQMIIREGDPGNEFFVIESGTVECFKRTESNPQRLVRALSGGDHFGELAIMSDQGRALSVVAKTNSELYSIPRDVFLQIYGQIEQNLKKDYNKELEALLQQESLSKMMSSFQQEKAQMAQAMAQMKADFDRQLREADATRTSPESAHGQPRGPQKKESSSSIYKKESANYDQSSLQQESLQRKLSRKIEENQQQDVWMTSGSKQFGKRLSSVNLEINLLGNDGRRPGVAPQEQRPPETEPLETQVRLRQFSKTNMSEENNKKDASKIQIEKQEKQSSQTPRDIPHQTIHPYSGFHYEQLNEQDENDLGFDDLLRQHQSLVNHQETDRINLLLNFENLVNTYDYLEDDQLRTQFYIDNIQNQQDSTFKWTHLQIKALIYLRDYHRLFSAQNIWKFNQKILEQIQKAKEVVCTKIIQQQIGSDAKLLNFKIILKATFTGEPVDLEDADDSRKYLESVASKISVSLHAECDQNHLKNGLGQQSSTKKVDLSFLEMQTILYMFSDINSVEPGSCVKKLASSVPLFHVDSFEDLCEIVLFKYVEVFTNEDESLEAAQGRQSTQACPYSVDFMEQPSNLLVAPVKIPFLHADQGNARGDESHHQSDNLQGQTSMNSERGLAVYNSALNCQVQAFHVQGLSYKLVLSPTFDLQTVLMRRAMMQQQNQNHEEAQSVEPENLCQLSIELQFDSQDVASKFFKPMEGANMKFASDGKDPQKLQVMDSIQRITNPQEFYESHLKKYIDELDSLLKDEYKKFLFNDGCEAQAAGNASDNAPSPSAGAGQGSQLSHHQRFFNLIINKKIAYIQLKIEDSIELSEPGADGSKNFKSQMIVALKDFEYSSTIAAMQQKSNNLKFVCLYSAAITDGKIKRCPTSHETSVKALSQLLGQSLDQGFYSLLKHYCLAQLCRIYLERLHLNFSSTDNDSEGSSLGGSESSGSGSSGSFASSGESGSGTSSKKEKQDKVPKAVVARLEVKAVDTVLYQRKVKIIKDVPIVVTAEVLACKDLKTILGVKFVAYDIKSRHESGVFLQIDQDQWPKLESAKPDKSNFVSLYSVVPLLADGGIDFLLDNYLSLEPMRQPVFEGRLVLHLKEPRLNSQKNLQDINHELDNNPAIDQATRQRMLSQMPMDQTTISSLERFLTKEKAITLMKNKK